MARYRLLHHTAVSFVVSSDIRVFFTWPPAALSPRASVALFVFFFVFYTRPVWGLNGPVRALVISMAESNTRIPAHQVEPVAAFPRGSLVDK